MAAIHGDVGRVDAEDQPDREYRLDRAGDVHIGRRRLEAGGDEEAQRLRHEELGVKCGTKNAPQMMRRITSPFSKLNFSASDMVPPKAAFCASFQWIAPGGARLLVRRRSSP